MRSLQEMEKGYCSHRVKVCVSVPLNCAILCHLWRHLEEECLPTTMTQLYTKVIQNVMLRNIPKDGSFNIKSLSDFNALPEKLKQPFSRLCVFAFQMLERNQIVFSQEELDDISPEGLALIRLFGLLQSALAVTESGYGRSLHFLHLTFQEFLAAFYLSRQPPETQLEKFTEYCKDSHFVMICEVLFWYLLPN